MNDRLIGARSRPLRLVAAVSFVALAFAACDRRVEYQGPDAAIEGGGGSGAVGGSRANSGGSASADGLGGNSADAGNARPCSTSADCIDDDLCNGTERCLNGFCAAGKPLTCFDGDPCTVDSCTPATGRCSFAPVPNGGPCQDGDLCDGQTCVDGLCTAGPPIVCMDDGNPCTTTTCDATTGACTTRTVADGTSCDDGDHCNGIETCSKGVCVAGIAPDCEDDNPCTIDSCVPATGCSNQVVPDGTTCSDGNLCNGTETCAAGVCRPGPGATCDDGNPCTTDTCNPATGACTFTNLADGTLCPDGNLCDGQRCLNGVCLDGQAVTCPDDGDNNRCTANACVPATGKCARGNLPDGTSCADANPCNGAETCHSGQCVAGTPMVCTAPNACTISTCDPAWGCLQSNAPNGTPCPDANKCNGTETCSNGACTVAGTPVVCTPSTNPCAINTCNPATGACTSAPVADGTSCADANLCNGAEVCSTGVCVTGTPVTCTPSGNPCTTNSCNPLTGACEQHPVANGTTCADSDLCDGTETCTNGVCSGSGTPVVCEDNNPCTTNSCNPVNGACVFTPVADNTPCSDSDVCNGAEVCLSGICVTGTPLSCDDNNPCTTNSCNPTTGCTFTNVADGTPCPDADLCDGTETCTNGVCSGTGIPVVCTSPQTCNPATGFCGP